MRVPKKKRNYISSRMKSIRKWRSWFANDVSVTLLMLYCSRNQENNGGAQRRVHLRCEADIQGGNHHE